MHSSKAITVKNQIRKAEGKRPLMTVLKKVGRGTYDQVIVEKFETLAPIVRNFAKVNCTSYTSWYKDGTSRVKLYRVGTKIRATRIADVVLAKMKELGINGSYKITRSTDYSAVHSVTFHFNFRKGDKLPTVVQPFKEQPLEKAKPVSAVKPKADRNWRSSVVEDCVRLLNCCTNAPKSKINQLAARIAANTKV
jgi:hypothetical protein